MNWIRKFSSATINGIVGLQFSVSAATSLSLDPLSLWDFRDPVKSEMRFRAALPEASRENRFILQTQLARTFGLRRDFDTARQQLTQLLPQLPEVSSVARARYWLEWGRTFASATHGALEIDAVRAREAFMRVMDIARSEGFDGLYVDATHMMAFVDTAPKDQLRWGQEALAVVLQSKQPETLRWEASIRNNIGLAYRAMGAHDCALVEFERAVVLRERLRNAANLRGAWYMVGRSLREMGRIDEALAIQLRLDREAIAANDVDPYVLDELMMLYELREETEHLISIRDRRARIKQ